VYLRAGAILAVPFDLRRRRVTGEPARVVEGISRFDTRGAVLSPSGTLVYRQGEVTGRLALADSTARLVPISTEQPLMSFSHPQFSPDGRRVAVVIGTQRADTMSADVWIFDVGSRTFTRLTSSGDAYTAAWTPDGQYVVFIRGRPGQRKHPGAWRQRVEGDQPAEKLLEAPEGRDVDGGSATPDGRGAMVCRSVVDDMGLNKQLFYVPFAGDRTPEPILSDWLGSTCDARVSPDGRWLTYTAYDGPQPAVYVRPFRRAGRRTLVSEGNAQWPLWSRDGSRLYYARDQDTQGRGALVAVGLKMAGDEISVTSREQVARLPSAGMYDVAPDGKRILVLQLSEAHVKLVVTTNWFQELRARLAETR
jgi:Tol biopolymer transport system component